MHRRMLFECIGICVLRSRISFKLSQSVSVWTALWIGGGGGGRVKCMFRGSVGPIIYKDYTVIRSSFISCSLTCCEVNERYFCKGTCLCVHVPLCPRSTVPSCHCAHIPLNRALKIRCEACHCAHIPLCPTLKTHRCAHGPMCPRTNPNPNNPNLTMANPTPNIIL